MSGPPPSPEHGSWYSPLLNSTFVPNILGWSLVDPVIFRFTRLSKLLCSFVWASILLSVCCLKIGIIVEFWNYNKCWSPKIRIVFAHIPHPAATARPRRSFVLGPSMSWKKYGAKLSKYQVWRLKEDTCRGRQMGTIFFEKVTSFWNIKIIVKDITDQKYFWLF